MDTGRYCASVPLFDTIPTIKSKVMITRLAAMIRAIAQAAQRILSAANVVETSMVMKKGAPK